MTFTTAIGHFFRRPNYLDQNLSSDSLFQHTSESTQSTTLYFKLYLLDRIQKYRTDFLALKFSEY